MALSDDRVTQTIRPRALVTEALTRDLLAWVASRPRTYAETMEAWRSSCPRLTIWEDALAEGLVRVENGGPARREIVVLTARGMALLGSA